MGLGKGVTTQRCAHGAAVRLDALVLRVQARGGAVEEGLVVSEERLEALWRQCWLATTGERAVQRCDPCAKCGDLRGSKRDRTT